MRTSPSLQYLAIATIAIALQSLSAAVASAQCRPPKDSHEAKLLAFYGMPLVFSADPTTLRPGAGTLHISAEGAYVPTAPSSIQRTQECYTGRVQHTALTQFFGRPRVSVSLPNGFGAEVSYLPPITFSDATPNLFGAAVWMTRSVAPMLSLTGRLHLTRGSVHGPITCPKDVLQQNDAQAACYGNTASDDEFQPNTYGGELVATATPWVSARRLSIHAGVGVNLLRPRFGVDFTDLSGGTDHTKIEVNMTRITGLLGAAMQVSNRCQVATQGYLSFSDGGTVRGLVGCTVLR